MDNMSKKNKTILIVSIFLLLISILVLSLVVILNNPQQPNNQEPNDSSGSNITESPSTEDTNSFNITYQLNGYSDINPNSQSTFTNVDEDIIIEPLNNVISGLYNNENEYVFEKNSATFQGWYYDSTFTDALEKNSDGKYLITKKSSVTLYAKWSEEIIEYKYSKSQATRVDMNKIPTVTGSYVMFGEYPQTVRGASTAITDSVDSRGYYLGSDNFYYAKVGADYYQVAPIKWQIISEYNNSFSIISTRILDQHRFDDTSSNYAESEIREWLNNEFYSTAFMNGNTNIITSDLDNSITSTGDTENPNTCSNTQDKVFLLSYQEAFVLLRSSMYRQYVPSQYSIANGIPDGIFAKWWLRTPSVDNSSTVKIVSENGDILYTNDVSSNTLGIVPTIVISLS